MQLVGKKQGFFMAGTFVTTLLLLVCADVAIAVNQSIGDIASNVVGSMSALGKLVISVSLVAGMGFALAAILKFKQHKDNPTQIPVGTPIALVFIAAALMFLPVIFGAAGSTLFGSQASHSSVSGSDAWITGN